MNYFEIFLVYFEYNKIICLIALDKLYSVFICKLQCSYLVVISFVFIDIFFNLSKK